MKAHSLKIASACVLMLGAALSGCVVAPVPVEGEVVAYQPPPPLRYEGIGVAPLPDRWRSAGNTWRMRPGHWEERREERR